MSPCRRSGPARVVAALATLALVIACGPRTAPAPPAITAPAPEASDAGLLWRVARGGAVSHLFGTVHLGRALGDALGPDGMAALSDAETVVVELDLDATDTTAALADLIARRGRLPAGRSLEDTLAPRTWRWVADSLEGQVPETGLRRLQPWLAVYLVIGARAAGALEPGGTAGVATAPVPMDRVIARRAKARGQRLIALETATEQIEALAAMPEPDAVRFLDEVARDPSSLDRQLRGLVDGTRGPSALAGIERMLTDYAAESPAMADAMFFDRTQRWVPRLVPVLADGDAFVAVGAGHLVGQRGLVTLLEARGFEVRAVPAPPRGTTPTTRATTPPRR